MSQTEVQLIKDAVIVNADISNSAAIDVSKISGAMPLAGGTFTDDVTFTGATSVIRFDKSDDALEVQDNMKVTFGNSADLQIFHNGTHSFIKDTGTGALSISGSQVSLDSSDLTEYMVRGIENAQVELYYDGTKRIESTSSGAAVTGTRFDLTDSGSVNLVVGSTNAGGALLVLDGDSDGNASGADYAYIEHSSAGDLNIVQDNPSSNGKIDFFTGGAARVSMQSDKFRPSNTNAMTLGTTGLRWSDLYLANDLYMADGGVIRLGDSADMLIQHTGNHNFIEGGSSFSGNLYLRAKLNEDGIVLISDAGVELYHNSNRKFSTTDRGVELGDNGHLGTSYMDSRLDVSSTNSRLVNFRNGDTAANTTGSQYRFGYTFVRATSEITTTLVTNDGASGNCNVAYFITLYVVAATDSNVAKIELFASAQKASNAGNTGFSYFAASPSISNKRGSTIGAGSLAWNGAQLEYTTDSNLNYTKYVTEVVVAAHDRANPTFP